MWILLNNTAAHRSAEFKTMLGALNVRLVFNAISTPQLNLADYFFEYVKRDLRKAIEMAPYDILCKMVGRAQKVSRTERQQKKPSVS